jgi:hypothetical protein
MEGTVPEPEQHRLFEFTGSDRDFLTKVGIKPCVIRCFRPRLHAVALVKEYPPRITGTDLQWLKECGVAWERKRAVQIPLDFSGCQKNERDAKAPVTKAQEG